MAGDELRLVYQIGSADRLGTKAQVRDGGSAGFLRVVNEVALRPVLGLFADDLDRVLVRADRAICAQTPEYTAHRLGGFDVESRVVFQAGVSDVVIDADCEVVLRLGFLQLVEDSLGHGGGEFLGRQTIAPTDDLRVDCLAFLEGGDDILVERIAGGAGFFRAVQDCDALDSGWQGFHEVLDGEGSEQVDFQNAHFLALFHQVVGGLAGGLGARAHHDHDTLGIRSADVIEQVVLPSDQLGEFVHVFLDDLGASVVEGVDRLASLEIDIRVLGGAAQHRMIWREPARPVGVYEALFDHFLQVVIRHQLDLVDLGRGAEAIEEMQERHARFQGGTVGDQRHILGFLDRVRGDQGKTGRAGSHHVRVVAEDRESMDCQRAGGDVENGRGQLTGNLEHVRDHQQQSLGGGEGG